MRSLLISLVFLWPGISTAGPVIISGADSSGGGKSVVCRDPLNNHVKSIELLDLFEARAMYGLAPLALGDSMEAVIQGAKNRFLNTIAFSEITVSPEIDHALHILKVMPAGTKLQPVDDASPVVIPNGCSLEQSAVWVDEGIIAVDSEHWDAMDARMRAALVVHEAIYARTRLEGETNSRRARKIVGHIFSDFEFEPVNAGIPEGAYQCGTDTPLDGKQESIFQAYPIEGGGVRIQFVELRGSFLYSKTTVSLEHSTWPLDKVAAGQAMWGELESKLESGRSFELAMVQKPDGSKGLITLEPDEKGGWDRIPVSCSPIQTPSTP